MGGRVLQLYGKGKYYSGTWQGGYYYSGLIWEVEYNSCTYEKGYHSGTWEGMRWWYLGEWVFQQIFMW